MIMVCTLLSFLLWLTALKPAIPGRYILLHEQAYLDIVILQDSRSFGAIKQARKAVHHGFQHDKLGAEVRQCCTETNNEPGAAHQALFSLLQHFDGLPDHF